MLAIANKLDGVITSESGGLVGLVDARDVVEEIVVNSESNSNGAVLNGSHHRGLARDVLPALDLLVLLGRSIVASLLARSSVTTAGGVLIALFRGQPGVLHVIESVAWVSSIAALIYTLVITGDKLFGRQNLVGGAVGGNRKTIGKRLGGGKSPARTALALITDGVDELGPLGAAVKGSGEISEVENRGVGAVDFGACVELDTEKGLGLPESQAFKAGVNTSDPGLAGAGVQLLNSAGIIDQAQVLDLRTGEWGGSNEGSQRYNYNKTEELHRVF